MPEVTIVLGLIEYRGKILVGKKIEGEHPFGMGGKWIFPGGEVEPGDTLQQAVVHELADGTGLEVALIECLGVGTQFRWGTFTRTLYILCTPIGVDPQPQAKKDLQELKWLEKAQSLLELDSQVVDALPPQVLEYLVGTHSHNIEHWRWLSSSSNL